MTKLKVALKTLLETVIHGNNLTRLLKARLFLPFSCNPGFFGGFVPEVQRRRRAVGEEECCIMIHYHYLSST